jgi:hypothetical protein
MKRKNSSAIAITNNKRRRLPLPFDRLPDELVALVLRWMGRSMLEDGDTHHAFIQASRLVCQRWTQAIDWCPEWKTGLWSDEKEGQEQMRAEYEFASQLFVGQSHPSPFYRWLYRHLMVPSERTAVTPELTPAKIPNGRLRVYVQANSRGHIKAYTATWKGLLPLTRMALSRKLDTDEFLSWPVTECPQGLVPFTTRVMCLTRGRDNTITAAKQRYGGPYASITSFNQLHLSTVWNPRNAPDDVGITLVGDRFKDWGKQRLNNRCLAFVPLLENTKFVERPSICYIQRIPPECTPAWRNSLLTSYPAAFCKLVQDGQLFRFSKALMPVAPKGYIVYLIILHEGGDLPLSAFQFHLKQRTEEANGERARVSIDEFDRHRREVVENDLTSDIDTASSSSSTSWSSIETDEEQNEDDTAGSGYHRFDVSSWRAIPCSMHHCGSDIPFSRPAIDSRCRFFADQQLTAVSADLQMCSKDMGSIVAQRRALFERQKLRRRRTDSRWLDRKLEDAEEYMEKAHDCIEKAMVYLRKLNNSNNKDLDS